MEFELVLEDYYPFEKGEILIVHEAYGREVLGDGRKSCKWSVATAFFPTAAEAVGYAQEIGITPHLPDDYPEPEVIPALVELYEALADKPQETS